MTFNDAMESVARSLREFGYPACSAAMVSEVYDAWETGKPLPHGIIGMMAQGQFEENAVGLRKLRH
jgi:hypothetical protein